MPRPHREYAQWTPKRLVAWAQQTGPATAALIDHILTSRRHPQQGFRSCLGILRLGKTHTNVRLEAACRRALTIGLPTYKSVASILKHNLDTQPLPDAASTTPRAEAAALEAKWRLETYRQCQWQEPPSRTFD